MKILDNKIIKLHLPRTWRYVAERAIDNQEIRELDDTIKMLKSEYPCNLETHVELLELERLAVFLRCNEEYKYSALFDETPIKCSCVRCGCFEFSVDAESGNAIINVGEYEPVLGDLCTCLQYDGLTCPASESYISELMFWSMLFVVMGNHKGMSVLVSIIKDLEIDCIVFVGNSYKYICSIGSIVGRLPKLSVEPECLSADVWDCLLHKDGSVYCSTLGQDIINIINTYKFKPGNITIGDAVGQVIDFMMSLRYEFNGDEISEIVSLLKIVMEDRDAIVVGSSGRSIDINVIHKWKNRTAMYVDLESRCCVIMTDNNTKCGIRECQFSMLHTTIDSLYGGCDRLMLTVLNNVDLAVVTDRTGMGANIYVKGYEDGRCDWQTSDSARILSEVY